MVQAVVTSTTGADIAGNLSLTALPVNGAAISC
jgi:hypothetical protein